MRKYRATDEIRDQQVQNCNTQSIQGMEFKQPAIIYAPVRLRDPFVNILTFFLICLFNEKILLWKFRESEKLLSIHYEESSSRDSGIPTTVLHDSLEVSTAHSPTSSRTASTAATSRYYSDNIRFDSVIGQGRFSTVWKVKCLNEVRSSWLIWEENWAKCFQPGDYCVKEFNASESASWRQERSVLGKVHYQHLFIS